MSSNGKRVRMHRSASGGARAAEDRKGQLMDRRIGSAPARRMLPRIAIVAAALLAMLIAPGAGAQTLTVPNPQTMPTQQPVTAKSRPTGPVKSCTAYGAGFVNVPGTDACIKVGGGVTVESTSGPGR